MNLVISIPENSICLLKLGQEVDLGTPYLEQKVTSEITLPIAEKLAIKPAKILQYIKKFIGEKVIKGDILAVKQTLFSSYKVVSDYDGAVKEINHDEGTITISVAKSKKNIALSFFKGVVADLKNKEIFIKIKNGENFPLKKASSDFGGEIHYSENLSLISGKVLLRETLTPYEVAKASALGSSGFIFLYSTSQSDQPAAQVKNIADFQKINQLKLPYCAVNKKYSTITFYRP